jgi:hypothetical protein
MLGLMLVSGSDTNNAIRYEILQTFLGSITSNWRSWNLFAVWIYHYWIKRCDCTYDVACLVVDLVTVTYLGDISSLLLSTTWQD